MVYNSDVFTAPPVGAFVSFLRVGFPRPIPGARGGVFQIGILGFELTEAVALFALLIAFLILLT